MSPTGPAAMAQEMFVAKDPAQIDTQDLAAIKSVDPTLSPEDAALAEALRNYTPGSKAERKLLWKIDLFMCPTLWFMCVLCYLDRNNIGNANAAGMSDDLGLDSNQYAMLISIFFIAYLICEVPSNLIITRVRPSWYVPVLAVSWGSVCACMSQVQNYSGIMACRFFLGAIEAGFLPGVMYIMSTWYKRDELGKRFSLFFTALCFAGAISGLLSGVIIGNLDGARGMEGWRWLFLIEGVMTVGFAGVAILLLMDYPHNSKRLSQEERELAVVRILHDRERSEVSIKRLSPLQAFVAAIRDLRVYFLAVLYMLDNGSATMNYFVPTVLQSMGYRGIQVQWMTIPLWLMATVFLIVIPQTSDRFKERRWHIVGGLLLGFVSAIICFQVENDKVRYVFLGFCISGVYVSLPLILTWGSELIQFPVEKRAVCIAIANSVGNLSAVYGSRLWPKQDAPVYATGFTAVACFTGVGALLAAVIPYIYKVLPQFPTKAELEVSEGRRTVEQEESV